MSTTTAILPLVSVLRTAPVPSVAQLADIVRMQEQCVQEALGRLTVVQSAPPTPMDQQPAATSAGQPQVHIFPSVLAVLNHPQWGPFELVGYVVDEASQTTNALFMHNNQLVVFT